MNDLRAIRLLTRPDGLATQLRQSRERTGLSQASFAKPLGWVSSKITRIERGEQNPKPADLDTWAKAAGVDAKTLKQWQAMLGEFRVTQAALKAKAAAEVDESQGDPYQAATVIRVYQAAGIPDLLQTPAYARALLDWRAELKPAGVSEDLGTTVTEILKRRDMLLDPTKAFEILLGPGVFEPDMAPLDVLHEQWLMLKAYAGMPRVRFGIAPRGSVKRNLHQDSFIIADDLVVLRPWHGEQHLEGRQDFYSDVMIRLWGDAVTGKAALRVIDEAVGSVQDR